MSGQYWKYCRHEKPSHRPSLVRYVPVSGLRTLSRLDGPCSHGTLSCIESAIAALIAHIPVPRSDTSTTVASPDRSRCRSAVEMAPAIVMAPMQSPYAGAGGGGMLSISNALDAIPLPDLQWKARKSYPPWSASGPLGT